MRAHDRRRLIVDQLHLLRGLHPAECEHITQRD